MNELVMPNNYVELSNEEMMYLEGSGFFKKAWKRAKSIVNKVVKVISTVKSVIDTASSIAVAVGAI